MVQKKLATPINTAKTMTAGLTFLKKQLFLLIEQAIKKELHAWSDKMEKYMCINKKTDSVYELPLEDLLKELEENGIDTSKLNIIEDTEETENAV